MLTQKITQCSINVISRRFIKQSIKSFESKVPESTTKASNKTTNDSSTEPIFVTRMHVTTNFDKWILTWIKKYPKGEVPDKVPENVICQTRNRARMKAANYLMILSVLLCLFGIFSGRISAKSGDTIENRIQEWHNKVNNEYKESLKKEP